MKRASIRSRSVMAAALAALISSLAPASGASIATRVQRAERNRQARKITLARTAEVKVTAGLTGVLIEWRTSFELDNLGFNLYREQGGVRTRVNPGIIAGSALTAGQGTPLYAGYSYQWFDAAGSLDARYYLEDLDLNGAQTLAGPFTPVWNESLPKSQQATMISQATTQPSAMTQAGGPAGVFERSPSVPAAIQDQWAISAQPGLKIGVKQDGWYRVTQPEMVAAGFDVSADARNLRLFVDARETPIEVSRDSGPLGSNDFIEFYGRGIDVPTTDTRVYYLINGSQPGARVPVFGEIHVDAIPTSSPTPSPISLVSSSTNGSLVPSWLGNVWAVVEAAKEGSSQRGAVETQSQVETARLGIANGPLNPPPSANDVKPAANSIRTEIATAKAVSGDNQSAAIPARAASSGAPKRNSKTSKYRRRRNRNRRSHVIALRRKRNHAPASATLAPSFLYAVQLKERMVYFTALLNGEAENFFGQAITSAPVTETFAVQNVQTDSAGTAQLQIALQGTSNQAHAVSVFLNDVMIGSINFSLQDHIVQTFDLSPAQLREGANTVKLVQGASGDVSLVDYLRLTYPHTYRSDSGSLAFTASRSQSATIDGFTSPNVRVLDISDPSSVQEVHPIVQPNGGVYAVTVPSTGVRSKAGRTLLAFPISSFSHPASITQNLPSNLNSASNSADFVIISHPNFIPSLTSVLPGNATSLVAQRQAQGFTVKVVDINDVYDEFSYGLHTGQAIKDFLALASGQWTKPPKYVLLVGDGSYDPRNYFGLGDFDFVPSKLVDTVFMETASDDTLADFDGDGIPEIPVGRLPVRTVAEADREVSKIVNFSPANVPQTAVMVADTQGSYYFNFEQASDQVSALLPSGMTVQKVYRRLESSDPAARANIVSKINQGAALVNYAGHGTVDVWTGAPIFSNSDAMALTNGNRLPLVVVMDCLNGYFVAPAIDCIGESFMKSPNGGAIATFTSSGLTIPDGQHQMGQQLIQVLYNGPPIALGDATRQAKAATTDIDVRRTWILFGDPTMKIR